MAAFGFRMIRIAKTTLLVSALASILLTAMMQWLWPCIGLSRFQTCEDKPPANTTADTTAVPQPCLLPVCDLSLTPFDTYSRITVAISALLLLGVASEFAGLGQGLSASALAGAITVLLTSCMAFYLYPYTVFRWAQLIGLALLIGLGAFVSFCGGLLGRAIRPNKTMEPTR